jgi:hypothetical protein
VYISDVNFMEKKKVNLETLKIYPHKVPVTLKGTSPTISPAICTGEGTSNLPWATVEGKEGHRGVWSLDP